MNQTRTRKEDVMVIKPIKPNEMFLTNHIWQIWIFVYTQCKKKHGCSICDLTVSGFQKALEETGVWFYYGLVMNFNTSLVPTEMCQSNDQNLPNTECWH